MSKYKNSLDYYHKNKEKILENEKIKNSNLTEEQKLIRRKYNQQYYQKVRKYKKLSDDKKKERNEYHRNYYHTNIKNKNFSIDKTNIIIDLS